MSKKFYTQLILLGAMMSPQLATADYYCSQLDSLRSEVLSCESNKQSISNDNNQLEIEKTNLENVLNNNNAEWELRSCQRNNNQARRELDSLNYDLDTVLADTENLKQEAQQKRQRLRQLTKAWECVLVGRKYASTTYGRGQSREEAYNNAYADPAGTSMFKKHGIWEDPETNQSGFCNRVF